jgi:hypothetical protein
LTTLPNAIKSARLAHSTGLETVSLVKELLITA